MAREVDTNVHRMLSNSLVEHHLVRLLVALVTLKLLVMLVEWSLGLLALMLQLNLQRDQLFQAPFVTDTGAGEG